MTNKKIISISITDEEYEILEELRGDVSRSKYLSNLIKTEEEKIR